MGDVVRKGPCDEARGEGAAFLLFLHNRERLEHVRRHGMLLGTALLQAGEPAGFHHRVAHDLGRAVATGSRGGAQQYLAHTIEHGQLPEFLHDGSEQEHLAGNGARVGYACPGINARG